MMKELFSLQKEVDELIQDKILVSFNQTVNKRKIAFKVELGELANEIGFFKYWKNSHVKNDERIKDEWADCLAFLNSIVITYNFEDEIEDSLKKVVLTNSCLNEEYLFNKLIFNNLYDYVDIEYAYVYLYKLGNKLGYDILELNEAYRNKTKENIRRAKEGY